MTLLSLSLPRCQPRIHGGDDHDSPAGERRGGDPSTAPLGAVEPCGPGAGCCGSPARLGDAQAVRARSARRGEVEFEERRPVHLRSGPSPVMCGSGTIASVGIVLSDEVPEAPGSMARGERCGREALGGRAPWRLSRSRRMQSNCEGLETRDPRATRAQTNQALAPNPEELGFAPRPPRSISGQAPGGRHAMVGPGRIGAGSLLRTPLTRSRIGGQPHENLPGSFTECAAVGILLHSSNCPGRSRARVVASFTTPAQLLIPEPTPPGPSADISSAEIFPRP